MSASRDPHSRRSWAVVGGGLLGLTLAHRLAQRGRDVTVYEASDRLGGLAAPWRIADVVWDRHYHVILESDRALVSLLEELGLAAELHWTRTRTGVFANGRLHSVSNPVELLRFPGLGWLDKARLGATFLRAVTTRDFRALERIPVEQWLRRWSGDHAFERFWLPLLRSKLGDAYRMVSAAFIWATIQRLYAARRAGLREERFGHVRGGYARILDRFAEVLASERVRVECDFPVERIESAGPRVAVTGPRSAEHDFAVVTLPSPAIARIGAGLTEQERARLENTPYLGIVCASLLLRRALSPFYVTNLLDEGLPFTGVIEMSALMGTDAFGGHALVYLPRYVAPGDPFFLAPDDEVREAFLAGLARVSPHFRRDDLIAFQVSRVRYVMALPTLRYSEQVLPIRTSVPRLFLVNSAQIVAGTLNVNETVQLAEQAVPRLLAMESTR